MRLNHLKLPSQTRSADELSLENLPVEVQDKIMLTLSSLKDFDALSQATPMFAEIADEYEHVRD